MANTAAEKLYKVRLYLQACFNIKQQADELQHELVLHKLEISLFEYLILFSNGGYGQLHLDF